MEIVIEIRNGSATIRCDGTPVVQLRQRYGQPCGKEAPKPAGYVWSPFRPEYDPQTHYQICEISNEDVMDRTRLGTAVLASIVVAVEQLSRDYCETDDARIEQGRRDWAAMSPAHRAELNAYAMKTEGHSID